MNLELKYTATFESNPMEISESNGKFWELLDYVTRIAEQAQQQNVKFQLLHHEPHKTVERLLKAVEHQLVANGKMALVHTQTHALLAETSSGQQGNYPVEVQPSEVGEVSTETAVYSEEEEPEDESPVQIELAFQNPMPNTLAISEQELHMAINNSPVLQEIIQAIDHRPFYEAIPQTAYELLKYIKEKRRQTAPFQSNIAVTALVFVAAHTGLKLMDAGEFRIAERYFVLLHENGLIGDYPWFGKTWTRPFHSWYGPREYVIQKRYIRPSNGREHVSWGVSPDKMALIDGEMIRIGLSPRFLKELTAVFDHFRVDFTGVLEEWMTLEGSTHKEVRK